MDRYLRKRILFWEYESTICVGGGKDSPLHMCSELNERLSSTRGNAANMECIYCDQGDSKVVDTRESSEKVRRRRECKNCGRRFTTYERAEDLEITVTKRSGEDEKFNEKKIRGGVERAAKKTSIDEDQIEEVVEAVKNRVRGNKCIEASKIGEIVKEELKKRDEVAYIRFASVYDSFEDVESFEEEVKALQDQNDN